MRAFVIPHLGAQTIELTDVPVPQIDAGEVLVQVRAVGVGIHDSYFLPADASYPYPIGIEASGVIHEVGSTVSGHQPGDRVTFVSSMQAKGGTWAEFVAVTADSMIMSIPADMDFAEAAAVPVAGNTVLKAFHALTAVSAGGSIFIAGGSGAIGTLAIQIAHKHGWRIAASASKANHDYMRSLGAEHAVDYHDPGWREQVLEWMPGGVDAAMAIQPGTTAESLPVVKDGGSLVSISGDDLVPERNIQMSGIPYQVDVRTEMAELLTDIQAGDMHLELEHVYPFDEALAALAKVQTRHVRGKLVLRVE